MGSKQTQDGLSPNAHIINREAAKDKVQELIKARETKVANQQAREQIMHIRTTTSRAAARKFRDQALYSEQIIKESSGQYRLR